MKKAFLLLLLAGCTEPSPRSGRPPEQWDVERQELVDEGILAGNTRIVVDTYEFDAEDSVAFGVAVGYADRNAAVTVSAGWTGNGLSIVAARRDFFAGFSVESRRYRSRGHRRAMLLVADGYDCSMAVVEERPAVSAVVIPLYDGDVVLRRVEIVPTGTGFAARPKKREDGRIDLELTPWLRDRRGNVVSVVELSARMTVEAGRPYLIMAHETRRDALGPLFFARGTRRVMIVVTVQA